MRKALFDEASGYYRTKNPIGKNSDFITAPEISQVFGELLAAYLVQISSTKKSKISLVEMGAGKGTLFRDILVSIKKLADKKIPQAVDFLERTDFHIVEINDVLQKIQKENLKDFSVKWHKNFGEFDGEIFFIANELFDCFPIDQFVKTDIGWCERLVENEKFILDKFDPKINEFVEKEIDVPARIGAVFEYSSESRKFMSQLCEALKTQGGMAIIIDYGYIKNDFANTLQALKNHQKVDVLKTPGEADITAHVDFSSLEKIVKDSELNSSLITQREFLQGLGIEERRAKLLKTNPEINSAVDRLIAPDQMGDLFKCLIIWKN